MTVATVLWRFGRIITSHVWGVVRKKNRSVGRELEYVLRTAAVTVHATINAAVTSPRRSCPPAPKRKFPARTKSTARQPTMVPFPSRPPGTIEGKGWKRICRAARCIQSPHDLLLYPGNRMVPHPASGCGRAGCDGDGAAVARHDGVIQRARQGSRDGCVDGSKKIGLF
jgi:hypothetical protein